MLAGVQIAKMKATTFLKDLKATRGEERAYLANFIVNFGRAAYLMHHTLAQFRERRALMQEATKNYVVSMASCLETFYRDFLVYVLSLDETTLERILPELKGKTTYGDIHSLLKEGLTFSDIAVAEARFQSLAEIDSFMSRMLFPKNYLEELSSFSLDCIIPSRGKRGAMILWKDWRLEFASIFAHRHSLVHDANKPCTIDFPEIQKLEALALTVPQITAELVAQKFPVKGTLRGNGWPVLLLVEDVIAEDWEFGVQGDAIEFTK